MITKIIGTFLTRLKDVFCTLSIFKRRLLLREIALSRQASGRGFESHPIQSFRNACLSQNSRVTIDLQFYKMKHFMFSLSLNLNPVCGLVLAGYLKIDLEIF